MFAFKGALKIFVSFKCNNRRCSFFLKPVFVLHLLLNWRCLVESCCFWVVLFGCILWFGVMTLTIILVSLETSMLLFRDCNTMIIKWVQLNTKLLKNQMRSTEILKQCRKWIMKHFKDNFFQEKNSDGGKEEDWSVQVLIQNKEN